MTWTGVNVPPGVWERMIALRRDLHQNPELSWSETRTAQRLESELDAMGIEHRRLAQTGVVAELNPTGNGPRIALRADTDALPIEEETGLEFSSRVNGVMHACGHDGHSAMLLGAAALLSRKPSSCPVRLIWQPAEELGSGAQALIGAGVLDGVSMIFGGHLDRHYPPGALVVTDGPVNASTDTFKIEVRGQQAHGARPHEAIDAVVIGSLLVTALQTVVSREVNPAHPSVVSVGSFHAGSAPNVIAGGATLSGTLRAQEGSVRSHLKRSIERIATSVGHLHDASISVTFQDGTPALSNEPRIAAIARDAAHRVVPPMLVQTLRTANMGGEDFAHYLEHVPGCYIRFGGQIPGRESYPAHSSQFDFDESALSVGALWFATVAELAAERLQEGSLDV